jgi:hypothetical protein
MELTFLRSDLFDMNVVGCCYLRGGFAVQQTGQQSVQHEKISYNFL